MKRAARICRIIAGYEMALQTAQNVQGMERFPAFYLAEMKPAVRALVEHYEATKEQLRKGLLARLATDLASSSVGTKSGGAS